MKWRPAIPSAGPDLASAPLCCEESLPKKGPGSLAASLIVLFVTCTFSAGAADSAPFRLLTLDPGHFHAALVQKFMYADVDPLVHVYAPAGDDLDEHLKRIERFNTRAEAPTTWRQQIYTGADFFERMLSDRAGNVVVIAGNNARKTASILRSVEAGLHVLADKPMAITPKDFALLQEAFTAAQTNGVLLYDIMTERFEITSILQRKLAHDKALFGALMLGSPERPAIVKESVHHFSKTVAGAPLKRPQWFFDVRQEGEGIVDVTTHLVDLMQWQAFPEQALQPSDADVMSARRWTTPITREQFAKVTGVDRFPAYLEPDVRDGVLHVYCNGEFDYLLRGVHARVAVTWDFEAPPGAGDTHYSIIRGTKANLVIRQGAAQGFKPMLYVEKAQAIAAAAHEEALRSAVATVAVEHPGIGLEREGDAWVVTIPDGLRIGHEAHFGKVTENFLRYLESGKLPDWEVPNMITKYATIMQAYERSRKGIANAP